MILLITYLLNLFDLAMTNHWVSLYGLDAEANPIGRWFYESNMAGVVKIFAVGGLLALLGVCIRKRPRLAWIISIPLLAYIAVAIYHLWLLIIC